MYQFTIIHNSDEDTNEVGGSPYFNVYIFIRDNED